MLRRPSLPVVSALKAAVDPDSASWRQGGCERRAAAPDDAGNIIRLSVTPIDSEHDVADFPSQRGNAVHGCLHTNPSRVTLLSPHSDRPHPPVL